jgi:hypothetical protein
MPSPVERSGRRKPSPLPTYTTFGSDGATASAPTEPVSWPSKMGVHVRAPSTVFHTPPLFGAI